MKRRCALLPDPAGLCGVIVFLALTLSTGNRALRDGDTLWHIRFGELMLDSGSLITSDTFSHTAFGQPWVAHEWLSEIVMALCYRWAGLPGVAIFYFAVVGLTFTLLFKTASRLAGDGPALTAVTITLPFAMTHLLARPHVFTWLGAALTLHLLVRGGRAVWWLVPVTAVWANLHGGVLLGLAIQALYLAGTLLDNWPGAGGWRERIAPHRQELAVFIASLAAAACNPFGLQLYLFPLLVSSKVFSAEIGEWQTPDFRAIWYLRYWLVAVFLVAASCGRRLSWSWRLLLLLLVWQSMAHIRHVSLTVMLLTPCTALLIRDLAAAIPWRRIEAPSGGDQLALSPWTGPLLIVAGSLALLGSLAAFPAVASRYAGDRFRLPDGYSQGLVDHLARNGFPGKRLLNHYSWGDYLIYALDQPPPVFIDGRADMYGEKIFSDYIAISRLAPEADELMARYDIDWVVFPDDHPFTRTYRIDPRWRTVYSDDEAVILAKAQGAAQP